MSAKIVGTFLRAALGPIQYAASLVSSNKVRQGIDELAPEPLLAALNRGVSDLAALVGVPQSDIEISLPMAEFIEVSTRLGESQPQAVAAWNLHAGPTGFMDIITALTVDGRKPEIGMCLERVAKKVSQDTALARPLLALARDVNAWEELIAKCVSILEQGSWLSKAFLRRRLRFAFTATIPIVVIVVCAVLGLRLKGSRDRVTHALVATDPCAIGTIAEADLRYASHSQQQSIAAKKQACTDQRAAEERAREEERKRREAAEKAEADRKAHIDACEHVASAVKAGSFASSDGADVVSADQSALLGRMAKHALNLGDIGPTDVTFPCADTPAHAELEAAFGSALLVDPSLWTQHGDPSPLTMHSLVAEKASVDPKMIIALLTTADGLSKNALASGRPDVIAKAKKLCGLARELANAGSGNCEAVRNL